VTLSNNAHCFKHQEYEAPTIGIISGNDERWYWLQRFWRMGYWSYVARSYVNLIEQTGARAVAVPFDLPIKQFQYLLDNIHGLIIPGLDAKKYLDDGSVPLIQKRIGMVIEHAKKKNDEGIYWPILGECHGLQATLIHEAGNDPRVESCGSWDDGHNKHSVKLHSDYAKSKLWHKIDPELTEYAFSSGELHFSHGCSIMIDTMYFHPKLKGKFLVIGESYANRSGRNFLSLTEYIDYPIFLT
jgi:gamma-glutamyl-gamma-aminobutyrate hydrolase PuuD